VNTKSQYLSLAVLVIAAMLFGACNKKVAKVVPPTPPPPAAPSATLAVSPDSIQQGQSTQLTWSTANATDISISGMGAVGASGSQSVSPSSSTTYTLIAKGAGGTTQSTARVTVNAMAAAAPAPSSSEQELFLKNVKDIFFDLDKSDVRTDQSSAATNDGSFLAQHPDLKVVIEGHCDDRGSEEYNLALGDSRANRLKTSLLSEGVTADRIKTISYGKEHPFCSQDDEQCWQLNRRDHLALEQ
jgi:peptidoglycan-associated lipoprotein